LLIERNIQDRTGVCDEKVVPGILKMQLVDPRALLDQRLVMV